MRVKGNLYFGQGRQGKLQGQMLKSCNSNCSCFKSIYVILILIASYDHSLCEHHHHQQLPTSKIVC